MHSSWCQLLLTLIAVGLPGALSSPSEQRQLWVVYDGDEKSFHVVNDEPTDYVAMATFENTINETGWSKLNVFTQATSPNFAYTDEQQSYAAGFVEGHITRDLIKMHWNNILGDFCPQPLSALCRNLKTFFKQNLDWVFQNIDAHRLHDPFWHQVNLHTLQIVGLQDGFGNYAGAINRNLDVFGIYLQQVNYDVYDLSYKLRPNKTALDYLIRGRMEHCSALLKLQADHSDLFVSHVTWGSLNSMLRILKKYTLDLHVLPGSSTPIAAQTVTFSSYPGLLGSGDDFYILSSGLITQETTIDFADPALLKYITHESVLQTTRNIAANRLASSGLEWSKIFERYNSGTYNNQWMIIDYKKFTPYSSSPQGGLFYLLEQIPGTVVYKDMTSWLYKYTFYASFNLAFYDEIFKKSGMPELVKKYGKTFTYTGSPRGIIFERDVFRVLDVDGMTKLMRYNDYTHDPESRCNCTPPYTAAYAISGRNDLNPANGSFPIPSTEHLNLAGTDMKLTTFGLSKSQSFYAISGPTYGDVPPFQWSTSAFRDTPHEGHPDLWKFDRIVYNGTHPF